MILLERGAVAPTARRPMVETDLSCDWVALVADRSASFWRSMLVVDAMVGGVARFWWGELTP